MKEKVLERGVSSPSEIAQLENIETVEYVFRFDVPMDHKQTVKISDCS